MRRTTAGSYRQPHGRILMPDGLRMICAGFDCAPEKLGKPMRGTLGRFRSEGTVWLTQDQTSELFDTARHLSRIILAENSAGKNLNRDTSVGVFDRSSGIASRPPMYCNPDVIISVGFRVRSKRGVPTKTEYARAELPERLRRLTGRSTFRQAFPFPLRRSPQHRV